MDKLPASFDKENKRLELYRKFIPKERKRYDSLSSDEQMKIDRLCAAFGSIRLFTETVNKTKNHGNGRSY